MKIVIYSSNSNFFDGNLFHYYNFPSNTSFWNDFLDKNPDCNLIFVTELPGLFLLDLKNNELCETSDKITYFIKTPDADFISELHPDLAIAASFWVTPYDWLPVKDAMIAEELRKRNVKVICNPLETTLLSFDKNETASFLKSHGFNAAKGVYVNHELFWGERNHSEIKNNFYKESVFFRIKQLNLPLIIKDTTGLSSYGMEVVHTYNEAIGFLRSKKNNGDKLVEEFIPGLQFGTEIHGSKEKGYVVFDPFMFSVNQYGITSPKQSIKLGPFACDEYRISQLKKELSRLAELLEINGVCQVDLVFNEKEKKWYIIEINPRLSGMTQALYESKNKETVMALKLPNLDEEKLAEIKKLSYVKHISQVVNDAAKQRRECGYCEIIFSCSKKNPELEDLKLKFPDLIDIGFYKQAVSMTEKLFSSRT